MPPSIPDRLYRWVLSIDHPVVATLLGGPNLAYTATFDPDITRQQLDRIEAEVFGPGGVAARERAEGPDSLGVLVRRSYAQFLGRVATLRYPRARHVHLLLHTILAAGLVPALAARARRGAGPTERRRVVIVGENEGARKLSQEHGADRDLVHCAQPGEGFGRPELGFLLRCIRAYPQLLGCPPLLTNLVRWLSKYGWIRRRYQPDELVVFAEGTPSCSILTGYLREHGIRHVNHMHGERFSTPAQAFCAFDGISVWGEEFRQMFLGQRWSPGSVRIQGTAFHRKLFQELRGVPGEPRTILIIHTQFLSPGAQPFEALVEVLRALGPSWTAVFRPHYHQMKHGRDCFAALRQALREASLEWQDPARTTLDAGLARASTVVGAYSTALLEAWIAGRKLIHLPGEMSRGALMRRYHGSPNVLFADTAADAVAFASRPADDGDDERRRVDRLVKVSRP